MESYNFLVNTSSKPGISVLPPTNNTLLYKSFLVSISHDYILSTTIFYIPLKSANPS